MFCSKINDTNLNFSEDSIYCKYCGSKCCLYHLIQANPDKYDALSVDTITLSQQLNEWSCPGCRSDRLKCKEIKYNPNTSIAHKNHPHYNKQNPENIWEIRSGSQREVRWKSMAHKYPNEYAYLNGNGGFPYDWDKQIKYNKRQLK